MVVLQRTESVTGSGAIRHYLLRRLELWDRGWIPALMDDAEVEIRCRRGSGEKHACDVIKEGRTFEGRVTAGKLREAVRILTDRSGGGSLQPDDLDEKTGLPVIDVLRLKHPAGREPQRVGEAEGTFEPTPTARRRCPSTATRM